MNIRLRVIQDSIKDRENHFALQKSVALFPNKIWDSEEIWEKISWQEQFKSESRICYVIETVPEFAYCGECAVKNISSEIPELEIELMPEYQHQGMGYKAIIMMFDKMKRNYEKQEFLAKVEPDNYASQFLMEKLKGIPAGLVKDPLISDERVEKFVEIHRYLLDERMQEIAEQFGVETNLLLTHLLVYKLNLNEIRTNQLNEVNTTNKKKHIVCPRNLSKEKLKDSVLEMAEGLEEIKKSADSNGKLDDKITDMEARILDKIALMETMISN